MNGAGPLASTHEVAKPSAAGRLRARAFIWLQHVLPQHSLSRCAFAASRLRTAWFKNLMIRLFLRSFPVDMSEAIETDPYAYASFNEFFTRALKPGARPIAAAATDIASPVDGTVSECGAIDGDLLLQAKGRRYTLGELLAEQGWGSHFIGGSFATIYLAPFNYHRVHMPSGGRLLDTVYVPGRLFSVNASTTERVPRLFARNERVLTLFEGEFGRFAVVLVGALNVGSIATVWAGDITPAPRRLVTRVPAPDTVLARGAELGRFNMGSTVILLLETERGGWHSWLRAGSVVRLGEALGSFAESPGGRG
ncbi:MAG TPA: archaetidylserine decarboxylase [Steroidobacteraceae bacterium]|nr:archaetidylserine decarboxylase [Steroidobacteraceae bacterium]